MSGSGRHALLVALLSLGACAGGSGIEPTKLLDALDASEARALCAWGLEQQGVPGPRLCGGVTIDVKPLEECVSAPRPRCEVRVLERCLEAIGGDVCRMMTEPACAELLACGSGASEVR